jgi:hypothetical protein
MPGGDGTGPAGMGPMTGRAAGYCAGYPTAGFMNPVAGRSFWGGRRGGGWGRRNMFYATGLTGWQRAAYAYPAVGGAMPFGPAPTREQEAEVLKGQAEYLEDALNEIKKRIETLESKAAEK